MPSPMTTEEALAIIDGYTALSPDMARVRDHLASLSDPGTLTTVYMAGAEKARAEMQAEIDRLRADACVALVADIRFACGDNGKRMQPELVEFIRGLTTDAAKWRESGAGK